jgi:hypothetical protein
MSMPNILVKPDAFDSLVGEWIGDIGQLHSSIKELPNEVRQAVAATHDAVTQFVESVPEAIQNAQDLMGQYDNRAGELYSDLLKANAEIQKSTDRIAGAADYTIEKLRANIDSAIQNSADAAQAMVDLHNAVVGKNGLSVHLQEVNGNFSKQLWVLEKSIASLDSMQISKLAAHQKGISAFTTLIVAALAFCAGAGVKSNQWLGVIGLVVLGAGFVAGMAITWLFSKKTKAEGKDK